MEQDEKVISTLDAMGISYVLDRHKAVFTIEDTDREGTFKRGVGCKNLFLRDASGKRHFLLVAREHANVDMKDIKNQLGTSRLSFGSEERLWNCLKLKAGSVSPFGVLNDEDQKVEMVFDSSLVGEQVLGFHPNDNRATVWLSFEDLKRVIEKCGNSIAYVDLD